MYGVVNLQLAKIRGIKWQGESWADNDVAMMGVLIEDFWCQHKIGTFEVSKEDGLEVIQLFVGEETYKGKHEKLSMAIALALIGMDRGERG